MSLARFAKRRDANERELIAIFQAAGFLVWQIDRPADLLLYRAGRWAVIETKDGAKVPSRRQLTPSQRADHALLPAGAIPIIESVDDALALVARMGGKA